MVDGGDDHVLQFRYALNRVLTVLDVYHAEGLELGEEGPEDGVAHVVPTIVSLLILVNSIIV